MNVCFIKLMFFLINLYILNKQNIYKQILFTKNMKRSSRRWKKKRQMRWKWQRKKLRKSKHLRKVRRERSK